MSTIHKVKDKDGVVHDIGNVCVSLTEPTGDNKPQIWIKPNTAIYIDQIPYQDYSSSTTKYYYLDDTTHQIMVLSSSSSTDLKNKKLLGFPYVEYDGEPYHLLKIEPNTPYRVYRENHGGGYWPSGITVTMGLIFFDENKDYISLTEESIISDSELNGVTTITTPATARYCCYYETTSTGSTFYVGVRMYENEIITTDYGTYYYDTTKNKYINVLGNR